MRALPDFRPAMVGYFEELTKLAEKIASLMAEGLGMPATYFDRELREEHTSYLRLNYYPPHPDPGASLGISPHRDAGFLTILWQDPDCHSLQVQQPEPPGTSSRYEGAGREWTTVVPVDGALTINSECFLCTNNNNLCSRAHPFLMDSWRHGSDMVEQSLPRSTPSRAHTCEKASIFCSIFLQSRICYSGFAITVLGQTDLLGVQLGLFSSSTLCR